MKALVLASFRAKDDHSVIYNPGEVKEFDNDRAAALAARGLVKLLAEPSSANPDTANSSPVKKRGKGKSVKKAIDTDTESNDND